MADSPDAPNFDDWAGEMGQRWLANLKDFENTIAPIGKALLDHAGFQPGERVLDIGFGGGATSFDIAKAVGPAGEVVGIDISPELVAEATRRAQAEGVTNVRFICADAAAVTLADGPYDRLTSRFGVMFFPDPVAAFVNLRGLLRPGGRMDLAVWGPPPANHWMLDGVLVAREHIELPPYEPRTPGPFAFEEQDYVREILDAAGFRDVAITPGQGLLPLGGTRATPREAQLFATNAMAFGRILLDYPAEVQAIVAEKLVALYERHYRMGEGVMMDYAIWLVTARA